MTPYPNGREHQARQERNGGNCVNSHLAGPFGFHQDAVPIFANERILDFQITPSFGNHGVDFSPDLCC